MVLADEAALVAAMFILLAAVVTLAAAVETALPPAERVAEDLAVVRFTVARFTLAGRRAPAVVERLAVEVLRFTLDVVRLAPVVVRRALAAGRLTPLLDAAPTLRVELVLDLALVAVRVPRVVARAAPAVRRLAGRRVTDCRGIDLPP